MLLTLDIGNTNIKGGIFKGEDLEADIILNDISLLKSFLKKYLEYTLGYPNPRVLLNSFICTLGLRHLRRL